MEEIGGVFSQEIQSGREKVEYKNTEKHTNDRFSCEKRSLLLDDQGICRTKRQGVERKRSRANRGFESIRIFIQQKDIPLKGVTVRDFRKD